MAKPNPALSIGDEDHAERIWGELVTGNYFAVLGVKPVLGRFFAPEEYGDKQGGYPVAVISYSLWKRRFSGDPDAIGSTLRVNRQQLTVIGVAPQEFRGSMPGLAFETWVPPVMATQLNIMPDWMHEGPPYAQPSGIAAGETGRDARRRRRRRSRPVAQQLAKEHPDQRAESAPRCCPSGRRTSGAQSLLLAPLEILMAVCGVVLLIVCANVANLLLARVHRPAARSSACAWRWARAAARLVRQLLTESLLLALGAVAVAFRWRCGWAIAGIPAPGHGFPITMHHPDEWRHPSRSPTLLCVVACVVSGAGAGLAHGAFRPERHFSRGRTQRIRDAEFAEAAGVLVVSEVALALVAIIGAGLFARSFELARQIHPGFDPSHVLVSSL